MSEPLNATQETENAWQRYVFLAMCGVLVWMPFPLGSNRPVFWSGMAILFSVLLLLHSLLKKKDAIAWQRIRLPLIGFAALFLWAMLGIIPAMGVLVHPFWRLAAEALPEYALPGFLSLNPYTTAEGLMKWLTYGAAFWLALQFGRQREQARAILKVIAGAGVVYALYGLLMYMLEVERIVWLPKEAYHDSLTGTFINRNHYALYAGLGLLSSLALVVEGVLRHTTRLQGRALKRRLIQNITSHTLVWLLAAGVLLAAILMTHSRAGIASVLVAMAGFCFISVWLSPLRHHKKRMWGLLLIVLLLAGMLVMAGGDYTLYRFSFNRVSEDIRPDIYRVGMQAFQSTPWLGSGLGSFEEVFSLYRDYAFPARITARIDHAHNSYLELLIELGVPGLLLVILPLCWVMVRCMKGMVSRRRDYVYSLLTVMAGVMLGIHALVDFSAEIPAVACTYAVIAGVGVAQSWSTRKDIATNVTPAGRRVVVTIATMLLMLALFFIISSLNAASYYTWQAQLAKTGEVKATEEHITHTEFMMDGRALEHKARLEFYLAKQAGIFSDAGQIFLAQAIADMGRGLSLYPASPYAWLDISYMYLLQGDNVQAARMFPLSLMAGEQVSALWEYRIQLALVLWPYLEEETRYQMQRQVKNLWGWQPERLKKLIQTPEACTLVTQVLAEEEKAQNFLKKRCPVK